MIQTNDGGLCNSRRYEIVWIMEAATNLDWYVIKTDNEFGLAQIDSSANSITLYRGATDPYWNYVRVRIWKIT